MLQFLREIVTFLFLLSYHNIFSVYLNYVGYIVRTKIMSFYMFTSRYAKYHEIFKNNIFFLDLLMISVHEFNFLLTNDMTYTT